MKGFLAMQRRARVALSVLLLVAAAAALAGCGMQQRGEPVEDPAYEETQEPISSD